MTQAAAVWKRVRGGHRRRGVREHLARRATLRDGADDGGDTIPPRRDPSGEPDDDEACFNRRVSRYGNDREARPRMIDIYKDVGPSVAPGRMRRALIEGETGPREELIARRGSTPPASARNSPLRPAGLRAPIAPIGRRESELFRDARGRPRRCGSRPRMGVPRSGRHGTAPFGTRSAHIGLRGTLG